MGLWGTLAFHISTSPFLCFTTWKSQAAKGVVEEKSLEGEAPKWMNSVVYKNLGLQICQKIRLFHWILKVGRWSIFPKVSLQNPYSCPVTPSPCTPPLKNPTSLLCALVLEIDFEMDTDTQMFHETCTFQVSRMYCTNVIRLYGLEISLWCLSFGVKLKLLNICSFMQWTWTEESAGSWKAHHECWKQGATPVSL